MNMNLTDYIIKENLTKECYKVMEANNEPIKLPYTFDIYNEGPKNKDYKITKANIYKIFFSIDKREEFTDKDGIQVVKFVDYHDQMIKLPLPANKITYKEIPNKENTKNWTEIPEIQQWTYAGAWYSDKYVEYNYHNYNKDWNAWFSMIKPYMKGKISVTVTDEKNETGNKELIFTVNNDTFNKERAEKINDMKDPKHLKEWADNADAKEKAEIKKRQEEEEKRKKAEEDWNKWWNSLSDNEKLSWTMGYGRGSGTWTGD